MEQSLVQGCVLHGTSLVYVATFTRTICHEISVLTEQSTGLSYAASPDAIAGVKNIANEDSMQAAGTAVYTANFGVTCHPQPSTFDSKSESTGSVDMAIGTSRGGSALCPTIQHYPSSVVARLYHSDFYPYFFKDGLETDDQWYGKRTKNKKS
jgi:hypothetical protein